MGNALYVATGADTSKGAATVTASTDLLTITAHGMADLTEIRVDTLTGGAVGTLVENAPYYVRNSTANTFQLAASPGGTVIDFATDGTANVYLSDPLYDAPELRRGIGGLLYKGRNTDSSASGPFGARPGVFRNGTGDEVTLAGTTVTVADLQAVIQPLAGGTLSGPYLVAIVSGTHALDPPDGSNTRIDLIVAEVQDDDEDTSGFRRARTRYVPGIAGSGTPAVPTGTLRLATATVPVSPNPATLVFDADFAVAAGAILPVTTSTGLPTEFLREGAYADQADTDALLRWTGSAWGTVGNSKGYQYWQTIRYTSSTSFTKASYPGLRAVYVRAQGGGGAGGGSPATTASQSGAGSGGQGGNYAEKWVLESALSASETVTIGAGGVGSSGANGGAGGTSSFGAHCSAGGGSGGLASSVGTDGIGTNGTSNTTATGDLTIPGKAGNNSFGWGTGIGSVRAESGEGGNGILGFGGRGRSGSSSLVGGAGTGYGGGGGGSYNTGSQSAVAGANGAAGIVIVDLFL